MSQLYVPDGTWTLCTEGKKIPRIQVSSQSTVRIAGGKLAATKDDRFDGNFVCFKMMAAGAVVGALAAAAIAASGGAVLGAFLAAGAAGAATGSLAGGLVGKIPSICSLLCKPAQWTQIHPKVKFEKKAALLQNATLSCLLGGLVTIKMPNLDLAIDMGLLAGEDIYAESHEGLFDDKKSGVYGNEEQKQRIAGYDRLDAKSVSALGLDPTMFNDNDGSGFYAAMYKKGDQYVVAYRGTEGKFNDIAEDGLQGVGISSKQYDKSVKLAEAIKRNPNFNSSNTTITGHSLGGGLAAIGGGVTNFPTYTYNAAGVHNSTLKRNQLERKSMNNVQAFNATDDPLNKAQDNRDKVLGLLGWIGAIANLTGGLQRASGQRMEIETSVGIVKGHTAIHIVNQLEQELIESGGGNTTVKESDI